MIVAVIDSAQVHIELSSSEVWEAGLEIGASASPPGLQRARAAPGCCCVHLTPWGWEGKQGPREAGRLAVPQGFSFSIFFGHFCFTGKVKGLVFFSHGLPLDSG